MKKQKNNIILFIAIFILGALTTIFFLNFHTVPDTYNVLWQKQEYETTFLKDGRVFSALFLHMGLRLNIQVQILDIISNLIALIANSTSVYIIYKIINSKEKNKIQKLIIFLGAFLIVFNPFAMEHLAYFETGLMCIGKLLCVLAAKELIIHKKTVIAVLLVSLSMLFYQGILNVFVITSLIFMFVQKSTKKDTIKNLIKMIILCVVAFITAFIVIKICNTILNTEDMRIEGNMINKKMLYQIWMVFVYSLSITFNLSLPNFILIAFAITLVFLLANKKYDELIKYVLSIVTVVLSCVIPLFVTEVGSMSARTFSAIGGIIGFSIIVIGYTIEPNKKVNSALALIFAVSIFIINEMSYLLNGFWLYKSNQAEKEYGEAIKKQIIEYENKTNNVIRKVAIYIDKQPKETFNNYPINSFTIKTLYTIYGKEDFIRYYLNRDIEFVIRKKKHYEKFSANNWSEFNEEQIIFENDTAHICLY